MKVIVLNILWWSRDRYYHWARFRIKGPLSREKLFTEETSCQQRKRLPRKRNTNRPRNDTSHKPEIQKSLSREAPLRGFFIDPKRLRYKGRTVKKPPERCFSR